jgi:CheY-like chemotaxis protein
MPSPLHVLLVEDDPLTAMNTTRVLRRIKDIGTVTLAADGRDAFEMLERGTISHERLVVLTDLRMPRMSGLELTAAIRASPALCALPVVFLTTSEEDADREAALAMDAAGYFVKPSVGQKLDEMTRWFEDYCDDGIAAA